MLLSWQASIACSFGFITTFIVGYFLFFNFVHYFHFNSIAQLILAGFAVIVGMFVGVYLYDLFTI